MRTPYFQFCCKPKTTLKKKNQTEINPNNKNHSLESDTLGRVKIKNKEGF
jgi:hypothetical protein